MAITASAIARGWGGLLGDSHAVWKVYLFRCVPHVAGRYEYIYGDRRAVGKFEDFHEGRRLS